MIRLIRNHQNAIITIAMVILIIFFILLKTYGFQYVSSDEWLYHYQGKLLFEGKIPYRDFFRAHPPIDALITGLLQMPMGFSFFTAKMLPMILSLTTGIFTFMIARKLSSVVPALFAITLLLFSMEFLRSSSHFLGGHLTTLFLILALFSRLKKRHMLCGIFCGCALMTRFYAVPFVTVLITEYMIRDYRRGLRMLTGMGMVVASFGIAIFITAGIQEPFKQLVLYHILKPDGAVGRNADILLKFFFHQYWLIILSLLGTALIAGKFFYARQTTKIISRKDANIFFLIVPLALIPSLAALLPGRIYTYYFLPALPPLAILAGIFLNNIISMAGKQCSHARTIFGKTLPILMLIGVLLFFSTIRRQVHGAIDYVRNAAPDYQVTYSIENTILPSVLDTPLQTLFFKKIQTVAKPAWSIHYYFWHEAVTFESADDIVKTIHANLGKDDTIFGESTSAPLVALLTGRDIAHNEVDTNMMRFSSGIYDLSEMIEKLKLAPPRALFFRADSEIDTQKEFKQWKNEHYRFERSFPYTIINRQYELWLRDD